MAEGGASTVSAVLPAHHIGNLVNAFQADKVYVDIFNGFVNESMRGSGGVDHILA